MMPMPVSTRFRISDPLPQGSCSLLTFANNRRRSTVVRTRRVEQLLIRTATVNWAHRQLKCEMEEADSPLIAHTISQRLRTLRKIPPELIPLGKNAKSEMIRPSCLIQCVQESSLALLLVQLSTQWGANWLLTSKCVSLAKIERTRSAQLLSGRMGETYGRELDRMELGMLFGLEMPHLKLVMEEECDVYKSMYLSSLNNSNL